MFNTGGLSKGRLSVLHNQLCHSVHVAVTELNEKWTAIGCESSKLEELLRLVSLSVL